MLLWYAGDKNESTQTFLDFYRTQGQVQTLNSSLCFHSVVCPHVTHWALWDIFTAHSVHAMTVSSANAVVCENIEVRLCNASDFHAGGWNWEVWVQLHLSISTKFFLLEFFASITIHAWTKHVLWAPHPISKTEPSYPAMEAQFGLLLSTISFVLSLPKVHDHRWRLERKMAWKIRSFAFHSTADAASISNFLHFPITHEQDSETLLRFLAENHFFATRITVN